MMIEKKTSRDYSNGVLKYKHGEAKMKRTKYKAYLVLVTICLLGTSYGVLLKIRRNLLD